MDEEMKVSVVADISGYESDLKKAVKLTKEIPKQLSTSNVSLGAGLTGAFEKAVDELVKAAGGVSAKATPAFSKLADDIDDGLTNALSANGGTGKLEAKAKQSASLKKQAIQKAVEQGLRGKVKVDIGGDLVELTDKDFIDYEKAEKEAEQAGKKGKQGIERGMKKGLSGISIGNILKATGIATLFSKGISMATASISGAISRVDTLDNSDRVFGNMGYSAEETKKTMDELKKSINGLPTSLDGAIGNVQLLASSTGDLGKSQKIFSALNNAILGFGGTAEMADNAIVQLSQAFSNGKIDAQTWNSMINSGMGPVLTALAKDAGMTMGEFKEALSKGKIPVEEFQDALIRLNNEGGGGLTALSQIAKDSTGGIGTSIANMKTAITRGVGNAVKSVDSLLKKTTGNSISEWLGEIGSKAEGFLSNIGSYLETLQPIFDVVYAGIKGLVDVVGQWGAKISEAFGGENKETIESLANVLKAAFDLVITIGEALAPYADTLLIFGGALLGVTKTIQIATSITGAFNAVLNMNPMMLLATGIGLVVTGLYQFFTKTEQGKKMWSDFTKALSDFDFGEFLGNLWKGITDFFEGAVQTVKGFFDKINNFVPDWLKWIINPVWGASSGSLPFGLDNVFGGSKKGGKGDVFANAGAGTGAALTSGEKTNYLDGSRGIYVNNEMVGDKIKTTVNTKNAADDDLNNIVFG